MQEPRKESPKKDQHQARDKEPCVAQKGSAIPVIENQTQIVSWKFVDDDESITFSESTIITKQETSHGLESSQYFIGNYYDIP